MPGPARAHNPAMTITPGDAVRSLRASARGDLLLDAGTVRSVAYVIDRRRGRLILGLPRDIESAREGQLLLPGEHDPSLAALLTIERIEAPPPALEIRFEVYHGTEREAAWAEGRVEALRYHTEPFDAEDFSLIDPILADEPALCREINADPEALRRMCVRAGARVAEPVAVGVDPDGIDVRARFGIVRVEFPQTAGAADEVRAMVARLAAPRAEREAEV